MTQPAAQPKMVLALLRNCLELPELCASTSSLRRARHAWIWRYLASCRGLHFLLPLITVRPPCHLLQHSGVRAVVGELSGLVFDPLIVGSSSVYVGPSSYAVNSLRSAYNRTAPNNGAKAHRDALARTDIPAHAACSAVVHASGEVTESCGSHAPTNASMAPSLEVETPQQFADRTAVIHLGVDLSKFTPTDAPAMRAR